MSRKSGEIDHFVAAVRRRVNRQRLCTILLWSAAVAAGAMAAVGMVYVGRGYSVPPLAYLGLGSGMFLAAIAVWFFRRADAERAAWLADKHFRLQDAVVSFSHFSRQGKQGGFYDLQADQTTNQVESLDVGAIKHRWSRPLLASFVVLATLATILAVQEPSAAVQEKIALEQQFRDETGKVNEELKKLVEQLAEETEGSEEEELIEPSELRKWVEQLEATSNRKEALRQYARLERKLNEASARLEQKRDEQLLQRAAKQLEKDRETKELAKRLEQKKYKDASKELKGLRPKNKKLDEQRKELARLKAAAARMAAALQKRQQGSEKQVERLTRQNDSNGAGSPDDLANESGDADSSPSDLEDLIEELNDSVADWEDALENAKLEELEDGECTAVTLEKCELKKAGADDDLEKLAQKLCRLDAKRRAQSKLKKLSRACSQCQAGLCQKPGSQPGGKKAGWGTDATRRDERDPLVDNGQTTQLTGTKGHGPSLTSVESASEGTGVSTRRHVDVERTFERQVESFVQREDVPENVKAGVKQYFKNIHELETQAAQPEGQ